MKILFECGSLSVSIPMVPKTRFFLSWKQSKNMSVLCMYHTYYYRYWCFGLGRCQLFQLYRTDGEIRALVGTDFGTCILLSCSSSTSKMDIISFSIPYGILKWWCSTRLNPRATIHLQEGRMMALPYPGHRNEHNRYRLPMPQMPEHELCR